MTEATALQTIFDLAVCRAHVGELSVADTRRLQDAEAWLLANSDGQRVDHHGDVIVVGRLE